MLKQLIRLFRFKMLIATSLAYLAFMHPSQGIATSSCLSYSALKSCCAGIGACFSGTPCQSVVRKMRRESKLRESLPFSEEFVKDLLHRTKLDKNGYYYFYRGITPKTAERVAVDGVRPPNAYPGATGSLHGGNDSYIYLTPSSDTAAYYATNRGIRSQPTLDYKAAKMVVIKIKRENFVIKGETGWQDKYFGTDKENVHLFAIDPDPQDMEWATINDGIVTETYNPALVGVQDIVNGSGIEIQVGSIADLDLEGDKFGRCIFDAGGP